MFKTTGLAVGSFLAGAAVTAAFGQFLPARAPEVTGVANIAHDCTTNGTGSGSCSFLNEGTAAGSKCVVINIERREDTEQIATGFYYFKTRDLKTIYSNKVCSGPLVPNDTRETNFSGFRDYFGTGVSPADFCDGNALVKWTTICNMTSEVVTATEAELQDQRKAQRGRYFFRPPTPPAPASIVDSVQQPK